MALKPRWEGGLDGNRLVGVVVCRLGCRQGHEGVWWSRTRAKIVTLNSGENQVQRFR